MNLHKTESLVPAYNQRQRAFLNALYCLRVCAICGRKEWCPHREPLVDLAAHSARLDEHKRIGGRQ